MQRYEQVSEFKEKIGRCQPLSKTVKGAATCGFSASGRGRR
jgi:hypothetical protein